MPPAPPPRSAPGVFGFVIHPPTLAYVRRALPHTRLLPDVFLESFLRRHRPILATRVRHIRSRLGHEVSGCFVICPLLPRQMLGLDTGFVLGRIIEAGHIAEREGASILGLGGYTSIVGDKGCTVAKNLDIAVTSGSALTAWATVKALRWLAERRGVELSRSTLAVIGATGSIGALCTKKLSGLVQRVTIAARHRDRLERLRGELKRLNQAEATVETDVRRAIASANLIITTTSAPDALFTVDELGPGSVVVDVSVPKNISAQANPRDDVAVADGGRVKLPTPPEYDFDIGLPPGIVYACMAETMALTLEGRFESFSLGDDISPAKVDEIGAIAQKHGFDVWLGEEESDE